MIVSQSQSGFNGELYEALAAQFLEVGLGMRVLGRRLRGRGFELDLVVASNEGIFVAEVKGSFRVSSEEDLERVDRQKIRRLKRGFLMVQRQFGAWPVAILAVGVSLHRQLEFSCVVVESSTTDF